MTTPANIPLKIYIMMLKFTITKSIVSNIVVNSELISEWFNTIFHTARLYLHVLVNWYA